MLLTHDLPEMLPNKIFWWCSDITYIIRMLWNYCDCVEVSGYPYYKDCNMTNMTTLLIWFMRIHNGAFAKGI